MELGQEEQPVSPQSRLMHAPGFNLSALFVMGFATKIDIIYFKKCVEQTLVKHPRFSSILFVKDEKRFECSWKRTTVNVEDHIFVPDLDAEMESPDKFVEDYIARVARNPFDLSKPLWEAHILNMETTDANSTVILKIHHSMGDGVSLISLFLACARKMSDPESLPIFPSKKKDGPPDKGLIKRIIFLIWKAILIIYYTLLDGILVLATSMFLKDAENPIKLPPGIEQSPKRYIHRIMKLEDVKIIKNAMKATINDVLLGATEAGLCKYLQKRYEIQRANGAKLPKTDDIINKRRIRINIAFNLRQEPSIKELPEVLESREKLENVKWGNMVGLSYIPLMMFHDSLTYVSRVKGIMDKRKISWLPKIQYIFLNQITKVFGSKIAAEMNINYFKNTTTTFSNLFGPQEEIILFGHPLNYIAPTANESPQELIIHFMTYAKKLAICLTVDEKLIPDPYELFEDIQSSLKNMKELVTKRGLIKDSR